MSGAGGCGGDCKRVALCRRAGIHGGFTETYLGPETEEEGVSRKYSIRNGVAYEDGRYKYE